MNSQPDRPWMDDELTSEQRARLLIDAMTLEEKAGLMTGDLLEGVEGFSAAGNERLGIPALRMADAGSGMRRPEGWSAATAMPAPIALAATWDPSLGWRYGRTVADECHLLRNNVLLGPNADLARVPWSGRVGESIGEDPVLAVEMTRDVPAGVQRPGVMVTYKHPMLYNQETNRGAGQNSIVDERTIREVYAPPFDAAIRGGAVSLMSSFNKINGVFACESDWMQNKLLRDAFGFVGFIMSDFLANHSMSPANGLDLETPGYPVHPTFYGWNLVEAVRNGSMHESVLDRACARILWAMFETGLFDAPLPETDQPVPYATHAIAAREIEEAAITLLHNDGGVLPLDAERISSIVVIGGDADRPSRLGGSSMVTITPDLVGVTRGLTERAPATVEVVWEPGADRIALGDGVFLGAQPLDSSVQSIPDDSSVPGVLTEYFASHDLTGETIEVRVDPDMTFNNFAPAAFHDSLRPDVPRWARSWRSASRVTAPATGEYVFTLSGWGDAWLWIDDVEVAHLASPWIPGVIETTPMTWDAGSTHSVRVEFRSTGPRDHRQPGSVQLGWHYPEGAQSPAVARAAEAAARADVAVVYARTIEAENQDSASLSLPRDQDALIRAVAAANPNTVVVLGTGLPPLTPWASEVAAIVHSYYGGQEQGHAVARVLFGDVNPSGKLPYTLARSEDQYETIGIANPVRTEWNKDVVYTEGLHLGYRGFDRHGLDSQFPFGHGLSYTSFELSGLTVDQAESDGTSPVTLRLTVSNVGSRAGAEVAQAYLQVPDGHGEPIRKLVGFTKVHLEAGEAREVEIVIDPYGPAHPLARWDEGSHTWRTIGGEYTVHLGTSSRDLRLAATFVVHAPEIADPGQGAAYVTPYVVG